ncbi:hypothetical protein CVT26_007077 [Gymnopilus dilepis]|uniref:Uncharacterized protein n=1 Tax=Gymnopilus dilepis TaxID=231916 RepID=A0A409VNJ8_9AGAR|nr:hypothetical protein CVT26_007077 [Gymnopilus dilepis]
MCYSSGSIDQAVNPCPMCRVYAHTKCPHIRETCRNRAAHPRMDVLYLTNAEVECFNGCGFCKWANTTPPPPPKLAGYNNAGWPGCCRPPIPSEYHLVQIQDWPAVSIVHRIPVPPQIDAILKTLPLPTVKSAPVRTTPVKASTPSSIRKNSGSTTPSSKPNVLSNKVMNTPPQSRGRSPQGGASSNATVPRSSSTSNSMSSSVPASSSMDSVRRKSNAAATDRRVEGTHSSHSSPSRKSIDLENPVSPRRVSSVRRPALTPATTSVSVSKIFAADSRSSPATPEKESTGSVRRRSSVSTSASPSSQTPRYPELPLSFIVPRSSKKDDDCSASSSSGSSDGLGSISDSTVTSEGFTDYLSDESEEELQRQAEARAAFIAHNQAEELEFKMARQQLAHVGLRPPKSWNPTSTTPPKLAT